MKYIKLNAGFSAVEGLLIVGVIALVGLLGIVYYNRVNDSQETASTSESSTVTTADSDIPVASIIQSFDDLDKTFASLDESEPIQEGEFESFDSEANNF